jgi:hypothetical protein
MWKEFFTQGATGVISFNEYAPNKLTLNFAWRNKIVIDVRLVKPSIKTYGIKVYGIVVTGPTKELH